MNNLQPIFRLGPDAGDITDADLIEIASNYDIAYHQAPIFIGHAENRSKEPSYGRVKALKYNNGILYAEFSDILPELSELIKKGIYKKPSVEIGVYDKEGKETKYLSAVSVTNVPKIKGLPDLKFQEFKSIKSFSSDNTELYFSNNNKNNKNMDELIKKFASSIGCNESDTNEILKYAESKISNLEKAAKELKSKLTKVKLDSAVASKKITPAQIESLTAFAESEPEKFAQYIESLPVLDIFDDSKNKSKKLPGGGKEITYADILKNPELRKEFSEDDLSSLRLKHF
ncbi:MAG: hypothetical protein FJ216_10120 [Ignavibacteria bacterium]|nr:hypothetical protein [Ignavibacteria bacterium]